MKILENTFFLILFFIALPIIIIAYIIYFACAGIVYAGIASSELCDKIPDDKFVYARAIVKFLQKVWILIRWQYWESDEEL